MINEWTKYIGDYASLFQFVWENEAFKKCSGSGGQNGHHYGTGGLKEHTEDVIDLCLLNGKNQGFDFNQMQDLFFSALWHDYGKIYDYALVYNELGLRSWGKTSHYKMVRHVVRSASEWMCAARELNYDEERMMNVYHAILAHHQLPEWGSPTTPKTKIAWILHLCDNMSARMKDLENK